VSTQETVPAPPRKSAQEGFSSRWGFVLATAGSAIGLGNIWRFPYIAGENGGGAFLVPYLLALIVIGMPVMVLELSAGRAGGAGVVGTFAWTRERAGFLGLLITAGVIFLLAYYLVVTGWAIGYFIQALADRHPSFGDFTDGYTTLVYFAIAAAVTIAVVAGGVSKGIERFNMVLVPLLFAVIIGLAVYAFTLSGRREAMEFYISPRAEALGEAEVWIRALGQCFFSVGVGMGVLITYGAYGRRDVGTPGLAATVGLADSGIALIAGFAIFPMIFTFGGSPAAGPGLAFEALPRAFEQFSPLVGYLVAVTLEVAPFV